ncbi:MAG: hypothetical protein HYX65_12430 [Gemmatimonadetes bacterium]|nr:hypothetical protein [Gemmatimonadota bacterium]
MLLVSLLQGGGTVQIRGQQASVAGLLAAYLFGGTFAGALGGALWPLMRSPPGAVFIGMLLVAPFCWGVVFARMGSGAWGTLETIVVAISTVTLGASIGLGIRNGVRWSR